MEDKNEIVDEALTVSQRIKRKASMRKAKAKIRVGRERAARKKATTEVIKKRARNRAKNMLFKKLAKGKSKDQMSYAQRAAIEKKMKGKGKVIDRLAKKLVKDVRAAEREK